MLVRDVYICALRPSAGGLQTFRLPDFIEALQLPAGFRWRYRHEVRGEVAALITLTLALLKKKNLKIQIQAQATSCYRYCYGRCLHLAFDTPELWTLGRNALQS